MVSAQVDDEQLALMRKLNRKYAKSLAWPLDASLRSAPQNALTVALHHLHRLNARELFKAEAALSKRERRQKLPGDPCFDCPDFNPAPPSFVQEEYVYPETSPASTHPLGFY